MRYLVSMTEMQEVDTYDAKQRMDYFLTRSLEAEEIWGLSNPSGWVMKEDGDQLILPIWPYEQMASNCATNEWSSYIANAISLDHFIEKILPMMTDQNIKAEILAVHGSPGKIVAASELASILEAMMESGEYYMEG